MENKPLVTCAGDENLFNILKSRLIQCLPEESVEWQRSHRNPKSVYVTANFVPFLKERLPNEGVKSLLGQAFFHIYWAECHDVDQYKHSVKEKIMTWLGQLKQKKIFDWLVVVVDHSESKKSNKAKLLPRTTVLDKIKSDFPSQTTQRCISLLDATRTDGRAGESWQSLLQRIRLLILQAYSRQLHQFEDHMRTQRERRNEPGWNFRDFFFLQEELAFVLEMLGLYDEALVQYDELDALFTQFVINSNVGDMPEWLNSYSCSRDLWPGVCLLREKAFDIRNVLECGEACLLDLRNYLFSRQCSLLLMLCRPWEVAQRTLPFLHNCISELKILEVSMPPGSVACWVFLSCFEVLQTCERFSDTSQIKEYSLYCAGLWAYAREKLHGLGILCGLMPDIEPSSEQLHLVVGLLAGMGEDPYPGTGVESPHATLRQALSSKESFLKHYLELSELTMGTFKHNRRIRTARLIGRDLAQFYMKMKQPQKAVSFLSDLLKTYREENWEVLIANTQQDLFACYLAMGDMPRFLKTCIRLAATMTFTLDRRKDYFQEILKHSEGLGSETLCLRTERAFVVLSARVASEANPIIRCSPITATFSIQSNLPSEVICRNVKLLLKKQQVTAEKSRAHEGQYLTAKSATTSSAHSPMSPMQLGELGIPSRDEMPPKVLVHPQLVISSYRQDGAQTFAVMCKNTHQVLRRRDSQGFHKDDIMEDESGPCFKSSMVKFLPGSNVITISFKMGEPGLYLFHRLWLEWGNIHFASSHIAPLFAFVVMEELPTISVAPQKGDLLAGIEQQLVLSISSGSFCFSADETIHIKASRGLKLKCPDMEDPWLEELVVKLPETRPFSTITIAVSALSQLGPQKNTTTAIEHCVTLQCPWTTSTQRIMLHFLLPFLVAQKLHTCGIRKYVQIVIHGMTIEQFYFNNAHLVSSDQVDVLLKPMCALDNVPVNSDLTARFLWEVLNEDQIELPVQFTFTTDYEFRNEISIGPYQYNYEFKLNSYETLFAVRSRVEPSKGSEFCRAGITCFMHITINQLYQSDLTSLMYEVVADQAMWTVCGRTAGVVNILENGKHSVTLDVMPLISGFLPLPTVRLSKYIPAEQRKSVSRDSTPSKDSGSYNVARLEPFDPGQIYSWSRAMQVHVLPAYNVPPPLDTS